MDKMKTVTELTLTGSTKKIRIHHSTDWKGNCNITYTTDGDCANTVYDLPAWFGMMLYIGMKAGNAIRSNSSRLEAIELFSKFLNQ
jgi:hypothetical protein